jgi:hypothetical protein
MLHEALDRAAITAHVSVFSGKTADPPLKPVN